MGERAGARSSWHRGKVMEQRENDESQILHI
jgi:hypothetical protein